MKSRKKVIIGLLAAAVLLASFDCPVAKASGSKEIKNPVDFMNEKVRNSTE